MKRTAAFLFASWLAAAAAQQDEASVAAERERLSKERARVEAQFKADEKACYAKFAVNDCLAAAKSKRRQAVGDLRRQEIALNDAERKRKAVERRQSIEERSAAPREPEQGGAPPPARPASRALQADERGRSSAAEQEKELQRRQAQMQQERQNRADEAARRKREQEERMAKAREREEKLRKRLAERTKPPASSLKDPP